MFSPNVVKLSSKLTLVKDSQFKKTPNSISVIEFDSVILVNPLPLKAEFPSVVREFGNIIDVNPVQNENALSSIFINVVGSSILCKPL